MQETFERATERHGGKAAPIKAFLPVPISKSPARIGAIFTDLKGKRRNMRLGSEIKAAKDALALREARNIKREDFDADKNRGMTLGEWLEAIFADISTCPTIRSARPSINVPDVFPRKSDRPSR